MDQQYQFPNPTTTTTTQIMDMDVSQSFPLGFQNLDDYNRQFGVPGSEFDQQILTETESSPFLTGAPQTPLPLPQFDANDGLLDNTFNDIMKQLTDSHHTLPNDITSEKNDVIFAELQAYEYDMMVNPAPAFTEYFVELAPVQVEAQPQILSTESLPTTETVTKPRRGRPKKSSIARSISTEQPIIEYPPEPDIKPLVNTSPTLPPLPIDNNSDSTSLPTTRKRSASSTPTALSPPTILEDKNEDIEVEIFQSQFPSFSSSYRPMKIKKYQLNDPDDPSVKNAIAAKRNRERKREEHEKVVCELTTFKAKAVENAQTINQLQTENSYLKRELEASKSREEGLRSLHSGTQTIAKYLEATLPGLMTSLKVPSLSIGLVPGMASNVEFQRQIQLQNSGPMVTTFLFPESGKYYVDTQNTSTSETE